MDIGIGLPNTIAGVDGRTMVEWARRAEQHGFSTLGTIGRIVYHTYEELVSLAAAAAVTERIGLTTSVLLSPLYANTALLAKQAATLDALSGGRFVLGVGLGAREDDYQASGLTTKGRGRTFDRQLAEIRRIWAGETDGLTRPVGPPPARRGGPQLLVGGMAASTSARVARYADGYIAGGGGPQLFGAMREQVRKAWAEEGKPGEPRLCALAYFSLGPRAKESAREALGDYYAFLPDFVEFIIQGAATDDGMVRGYIEQFVEAGCDELIFIPCSSSLEQVELLAAAAL